MSDLNPHTRNKNESQIKYWETMNLEEAQFLLSEKWERVLWSPGKSVLQCLMLHYFVTNNSRGIVTVGSSSQREPIWDYAYFNPAISRTQWPNPGETGPIPWRLSMHLSGKADVYHGKGPRRRWHKSYARHCQYSGNTGWDFYVYLYSYLWCVF